MLSEHERRQLSLIEQGLRDDDGRFVASFRRRRSAPRQRWWARALLTLGLLLVALGLLTLSATLVLEGLMVVGVGVAWSRWPVRRGTGQPPDADVG